MNKKLGKSHQENENSKVITSNQISVGLVFLVIGAIFTYLIFSNLQIVGITIASITAFAGYKNIKIAQDKLDLDQENNRRNLSVLESKQTTDRFARAIEHLGDDKVDIQMGGIYELGQIGIDSHEYHWTIIEILSAFVRRKSPSQEYENYREDENSIIDIAVNVIGRRKAGQDPDCKFIDLRKVNLTEIEIEKKANFINADFSEARLNKAKLIEINFSNAKLYRAKIAGADLSKARMNGTILIEAQLNQAKLFQADLSEADLTRADLTEADLGLVNLARSNLTQSDLSRAKMTSANLDEADLSQAKLNQATLIVATFIDANLNRAEIKKGELFKANLTRANLCGADLTGSDFTKAILSEANLCATNLSGADLSFADLRGVSLKEADLTGANLWQVDLREVSDFTYKQIKMACNWDKAIYDPAILDSLRQDRDSDPKESITCHWPIPLLSFP